MSPTIRYRGSLFLRVSTNTYKEKSLEFREIFLEKHGIIHMMGIYIHNQFPILPLSPTILTVDSLTIEITRRRVKNMRLSIHPPHGDLRIVAPLRTNPDIIRAFVLSKQDWIEKQQTKIRERKYEAPKEYSTGERHSFRGKNYMLCVVEKETTPKVVLDGDILELSVRKNATLEQKQALLDTWYRDELRAMIPRYIADWELRMNVIVTEFRIKKMKTRWGTCNARAGRIWLSLELAKKPIHCLEYVVIHEMVHLLVQNHGPKFIVHMDNFLPEWRAYKKELNGLKLDHDNCGDE